MQNEKPRASSCDGVAARKSPDDWLGALARRYRDGGHKLESIALETLEKLAGKLGFSRGYFIIHRLRSSSAGRDGSSELNFDVCASRLRLDGQAAWVDVTNPDFAVSRPVVRLALDSRELVVLEGEAGAGGSDAPGTRPALCRSFDLGEQRSGFFISSVTSPPVLSMRPRGRPLTASWMSSPLFTQRRLAAV